MLTFAGARMTCADGARKLLKDNNSVGGQLVHPGPLAQLMLAASWPAAGPDIDQGGSRQAA